MSRAGGAVTAEDLGTIIEWLAEQTGLDFDGSHEARMVVAVRRAFEESGATSLPAYLDLLRGDRGTYDALADHLTVGETYFFREPRHFELLTSTIAAERSARRGPLRVWSAGCASGEEPYSVAITLAEARRLAEGATIIGTDLSEAAIERARRAVYGNWSLRRCSDAERRAWFRPHGRRFRLRHEYREAVAWGVRGLLEGSPAGSFDVVLCRNVLIYLSRDAVREAAEVFHDALAPDGWLLVGASDPVLEHPRLEILVGQHGIAYRRADARRTRPPARSRAEPSTSAPAPAIPSARQSEPAAGPPRAASTAVTGFAPPAAGGDPVIELVPARLDPRARYQAAVERLEAGDRAGAAAEASAARYLDGDLIAAHLLLAHLAELDGQVAAAARSYRTAVALLSELPGDVTVALVEEPAGQVLDGVLRHVSRLEGRS